ncbi:MAG: low temperature requirement protein A [Acidimicrobiia bacterium]|nr:low temperature requirement protein A [Acidimicrobiia bacterium]
MKLAAINPPRLRTVEEEHRSATWLELFYDLVFVAVVAVLSARLLDDTSWTGWLSYVGYFILVWWLWASHTFYADRYDTDDLVYRLFAAAQMVAIAFIAASLSTGPSASTVAFAAAYAAARLLLLGLYARVYLHVESTRTLVRGYLIGHGIAAAIWIVSIFVPEPGRFYLWAIALAIDLATPYVLRKEQAKVPLDVSHLPERFGLFTILVLGETIVAVTLGLGHVPWQWATSIAGALGIILATSIWWVHFDNLDGFVVRRRGQRTDWRPTVWIYSHLPLAIGIAMMGVGVEHAIVAADADHEYHAEDRVLLTAAVVIAFLAIAAIESASMHRGSEGDKRTIVITRLFGALGAAIVGVLMFLGPVWTLLLLVFVAGLQIVADVVRRSRVPEELRGDDDVSEVAIE